MSFFKKIFLLIGIIGLKFQGLAAQTPEIDSLKLILTKMPQDTQYVKVLNFLSRKLAFVNPLQAVQYGKQMSELAQKLQYSIGEAQAYNNLAIAYDIQSQYGFALENIFKALKIYEKLKNPNGIASCFTNIANIYSKQNDLIKALTYYRRALAIRYQTKEKRGIGTALHNIAATYDRLDKLDSALFYYEKSLEIKNETKDQQGLAYTWLNIGFVYFKKRENLSEALSLEQKALQIFEKIKDKHGEALALGGIINIYIETEKYVDSNLALKYAQQRLVLADQLNSLQTKADVYKQLAKIYALKLDYEKAFEYQVFANTYRDSLNNETNIRKIERIKYDYELSKKDIENQRLTDLQKLQLAENQRLQLEQENLLQDSELQLLSNQRLQLEQKNLLQGKKIREAENARLQLKQKNLLQDKSIQTSQINLKNAIIGRQRLIGRGILLIVFLLIILSWVLFRNYRLKQKDNQLLNQQKEEILLQNESINAQNLKLEELNTIKDKLFSVISHDFRSPLNSLQGVLTLLNTNSLSEKEMQYLTRELGEKVGVTLSLLDNLLNWSKNQMQGIKVNPIVFELNPLIEDNFRLFQSQADKKKVKLVNQAPPTATAFADPDMINMVLRNLIANAVKFTDVEDEIRVSAQRTDKHIQISVHDTGKGIKAENLKKIFQPDTYFTTLGTANEKGNGLGLQIVQDFVVKNGGKIWVESQEGDGSTFYFTLPENEQNQIRYN